MLFYKKKSVHLQPENDSVAQSVEQLTLNQWVEGSSPSGVTLKIKHLQINICRCFFIVAVFVAIRIQKRLLSLFFIGVQYVRLNHKKKE